MARLKLDKRGYSKKPAFKSKVATVMREWKAGKLRSGPGGKGGPVKSQRQAVAVALSEARKYAAGRKFSKRTVSGRTRSRPVLKKRGGKK